VTDRASLPFDMVNRPAHYNSHPSGVETVRLTEHLSAMIGSAVKYVWRRGLKGPIVQDLEKAAWCFRREADRLREFDDASLWDGDYWRPLAKKVTAIDTTVLGDVLRVLLAVSPGVKDVGACRQMAELCEREAEMLRTRGL